MFSLSEQTDHLKTSSKSILFIRTNDLPRKMLCAGIKTKDQTIMLVHKDRDDPHKQHT